MAQQYIYGKEFIEDFQAQTSVPFPPSTYARLYYDGTNLVCYDSAGNQLIGGGGGGAVSSVFTRTGAVVAVSGDYTVAQVTGAAPSASPTFTGTPAAPTAAPGTNTTQLATTAFVTAAVATAPGTVTSVSGTTNQINVATGTTTPVLSLPSTVIAPGSVAATTTVSTGANAGTQGALTVVGTNSAESFVETSRVGVGFPVPYFTPTTNTTTIALDLFPKGSPSNFTTTTGVAWVDVCSTDIIADGSNYECLRLGKFTSGGSTLSSGHVSTAAGGTGVVRNLYLNLNGGQVTIPVPSAPVASTSAFAIGGTILTGGSGTTNFPHAYINGGNAPTTWNTSGTYLGINAVSGFAGNFLDFHVNGGASVMSVGSTGSAVFANSIATAGSFVFSSSSRFSNSGDGIIVLLNSAQTTFGRLQFGGTTSAFPALKRSASVLQFDLADDSALTYFNWGGQTRVSTQFDKTSDATLGNVTGLSVAVAAGRTYTFEAMLHVNQLAVGGSQFAIGGTATATSIIYAGVNTVASTGAIVTPTTGNRATALAGVICDSVTGSTLYVTISGTITVNAAGTLTVQFAQKVSNGTASSVLVGSSFTVYDCP